MKRLIVALTAALCVAFPAWAEAQTVTRSNSTDGSADGGEITRDVTFLATDFAGGAFVSNVVVTLDFAKIDGNFGGTCGPPPVTGGGNTFDGELYYELTSPEGTTINLISADTYASGVFGGQVVVELSDAAATAVGGAQPTSGTFRPSQALSAFGGQDPEGTWTLTIGDNSGGDPHCFYNVDIAVTTGSVLIGSDLSATPSSGVSFGTTPTLVQTGAPSSGVAAGGMTAPFDGVVVRWSVKAASARPDGFRLRIVRPGLSTTATGAGTGPRTRWRLGCRGLTSGCRSWPVTASASTNQPT